MIRRMFAFAALAAMLSLASPTGVAQPDKKLSDADKAKVKKALQEIQDFIGTWNLEGTQKDGAKVTAWKEKVNWGWKFKDGDAWLIVSFSEGKGKYYTEGELRYDVEKKKYLLSLVPTKGEKEEFVGDFAKGTLKVERKDAKTGDVYRLTMNTLSDGDRFALKAEKQDGGKGLFSAVYKMDGNKDGIAKGGPKKPECVVSGGAATIQVTHNGKTYYVCCSGCRDEFNANPAKYAK